MCGSGGRGQNPWKLALLFMPSLIALHLSATPADALNVGIVAHPPVSPHANPLLQSAVSLPCSRTCESDNCLVPPLLRYGKYCGVLYSGCAGEKPCDGLDACCQRHDNCIGDHGNDYLNTECSHKLLECIEAFRDSRAGGFKGGSCEVSDVVDMIHVIIEAALFIGQGGGHFVRRREMSA